MTKSNYITDVGKAIEKLADALDPQRSKPFRGDILDLLEWAKKDVLEMRSELAAAKAGADTAWAQAHRLALELECLIMDTKDNAIVSKWWDSAFEAIEEYNKLKPGAAEDAEAWAKMRKVGIAEKGTRRHGAEGAREMSDSDYWFNRGFEAGKESLRQQLTAAQEREQTNDTLLEQQGDKLAALNDLVAELRQQLADRDEQISDLTISSDTYFAERNSARDVWRRASKDRDELRQQLAESNRRIEYEQLCASELEQQLSAKQAEVDALMLEYCPSEMSQEQLDNWAAHQRPAKEQGK